ncbi:MAG: hypothetical protein V7607_1688 [Solirubrobacteraceae bacterium]
MFNYDTMFRLDGKRAVVVGAGAGIGAATACGLAAFGATVVCADRDLEAAEATAASINGDASPASAFRIDVTSAQDCADAVRELEPADVLVVTPGLNVRKPLLETTDEEFERVFAVNLLGTYRLIRDFGRGMGERGQGSIIVFSSFRSQTVEVGQGLYAACKAGVVQLMRALADELGERGVRVNAVAPGTVETPLTAQIKNDPEWYEAYRTKSILKRWADPHEMVGGIVYLASDAASYTTGALLMQDGGWTAADGRFRPNV